MKTIPAVLVSALMISGGAYAKDKKKHKKPTKPPTEASAPLDSSSVKK